jgi:molybdopterin converting factor small subunit
MKAQSTITVRVKLFGFLAQLSRQAELDMRVERGTTIADLIQSLANHFGSSFRQALLDWHGNLHGGIEVVLNREHISARRISEIRLWDDSDLIIMPLIGGGQDIRFVTAQPAPAGHLHRTQVQVLTNPAGKWSGTA